jgi:hydroxymethylpyrimidine pyrophosphatase-like HAD family hydrolase
MTKLFASDFDGTLHFSDFSGSDDSMASEKTASDQQDVVTSQENLNAIQAFQRQGGLFGICTGRPFHGLVDQIGHEIPFDFCISSTGAAIHDRDWNCLWRKDATREDVMALYQALRPFAANESSLMLEAGDCYWLIAADPDLPMLRRAESLDDVQGPFTGIGMETATVEAAQEAAAYVRGHFAGTFDAFVNLASIDVVPAGCSKGTGLRRAAELFGAKLTAGIGDSYNDLPLLDAADVAYTFPRVDPAIHPAADLLVATVAEALDDFSRR